MKILLVLVAGAWLAGCASIPAAKLSSGALLAKAGVAAASQMQQNVTISADSLGIFAKAAAFNDGFNGTPDGSATLLGNVKKMQGALVRYSALLQSLSTAYSAMDDLAEYGASADLDSAIDGLASDVATFGKSVGKEIAIPANVTKGLQEAGNVIVGSVQTEKLVKESAKIEIILETVISILSEPATREAITPIAPKLQGVIDQAAFTLYTQGVYTYRPILNGLGAPLGLESTPGADAIVVSNARVKAGLAEVVNQMTNSQIASATDSYDNGLSALKSLSEQHKRLQAGEAVTIRSLSDIIANLRALAQVASPTKTGVAK